MARHRVNGKEWWCLPGGGLEGDETPEKGALRELREECNVDGVIVRKTSQVSYADPNWETYTFLVDIGDQTPSLGCDPEVAEGTQPLALIDIRWLRLSEIPERDRVYLWASGLLSTGEFQTEVDRWGDEISYPG